MAFGYRHFMIDHTGVPVADLQKSIVFYKAALAPLGYELIMQHEHFAGFGVKGKPDFWLSQGPVGTSIHIAFAADRRSTVKAFYQAALAANGRDNGAPGVREMYHPHYFGAFVLDPDGHNIEAVCHLPYLG